MLREYGRGDLIMGLCECRETLQEDLKGQDLIFKILVSKETC